MVTNKGKPRDSVTTPTDPNPVDGAARGPLEPRGVVGTLPFKERFRHPILAGRKVCTARTKRYGEPGDVLRTSFGFYVLLEKVCQHTLRDVRDNFWAFEGLASPGEFEAIWKEIHPGRGFDAGQTVWLHTFRVYPPSEWS